MHCPICGYTTVKARLDVYWCEKCERSWLIHQLKYKSFEEASETNYEAQLKKDFLEPIILPLKEVTK